jgi:hypothetical protein
VDGALVTGASVGAAVDGAEVDGASVGAAVDGASVGATVDGTPVVGSGVGSAVVGLTVLGHGKHDGQTTWLRLFLLTTSPHGHGAQVTCTVGSVGSGVVGAAVVGSAVVGSGVGSAVVGLTVLGHGKHDGQTTWLRLFLAATSPHGHGAQVT